MELEPLPIGTSGRLQAIALANPSGSHAILVREAGEPRALLIADPPSASRERNIDNFQFQNTQSSKRGKALN